MQGVAAARAFDMAEDDPISEWLEFIKRGDEEAIAKLWDAYGVRIRAVVFEHLYYVPLRRTEFADSVFSEFAMKARQQGFPELENREHLMKLVITITKRKACKKLAQDKKKWITNQEVWETLAHDGAGTLDDVEVADDVRFIREQLDDDADAQRVLCLSMEGLGRKEIAESTGFCLAKIHRKFELIDAIIDCLRQA